MTSPDVKRVEVSTVQFIAEVSSNHHRSLERCLAFVERAAEVGCAAVKFQLFRIADLFAPEILSRSEKLRRRAAWELPLDFLPHLAERSRRVGIEFAATPFSLEAVDQLFPHVSFYKIASYELLWDDLLKRCARTGKPVMLSTGMATLDEVRKAVDVLRGAGCSNLTLLHCVSSYPCPPEACNLAAIATLRAACACPVGWSDHTVDPGVIHRAVHRWGAGIVEFHLDLEGSGAEYAAGHCWLPDQIGEVIAAVRRGAAADGSGVKEPAASEMAERPWRADPQDGLRPLRSIRATWKP